MKKKWKKWKKVEIVGSFVEIWHTRPQQPSKMAHKSCLRASGGDLDQRNVASVLVMIDLVARSETEGHTLTILERMSKHEILCICLFGLLSEGSYAVEINPKMENDLFELKMPKHEI